MLGQQTGSSTIVNTVVSSAAKYTAQYAADMMGYAMYATPIGIVIGFIIQFIRDVIIGQKPPQTPTYMLAVALPVEQVPTVGTTLLAGTHFKLITPGSAAVIPPEGALVLAVDFGDFPQIAQAVKSAEPKISEFQQKFLTPFFITLQNLTPERQVSMINTLMRPPLWAQQEDFFYQRGLSRDYHAYPLVGLAAVDEYGFEGLSDRYFNLVQMLNDAFLRRIYRSVLDSPALTPEQYGQVMGPVTSQTVTMTTAPVTSDPNTDATAGSPTLPPQPLSSANYLPLFALGGLALFAMKGKR